MKQFWPWFIPFILIICSIIYMLILKVNNTTKLFFNNTLEQPEVLLTIDDRNIYSIYENNKYQSISLKEAFNKNIISLNDLINNMELNDTANDGGSKIYFSDKIANEPFYVIECKTLDGNNDIYILNEKNVNYCRSKK